MSSCKHVLLHNSVTAKQQLYYVPCLIACYSRVLCVGSNDMNTRIYGAEKLDQLVIYSMGGHRDAIVGSFFLNNSLDVSFPTGPCSFYYPVIYILRSLLRVLFGYYCLAFALSISCYVNVIIYSGLCK